MPSFDRRGGDVFSGGTTSRDVNTAQHTLMHKQAHTTLSETKKRDEEATQAGRCTRSSQTGERGATQTRSKKHAERQTNEEARKEPEWLEPKWLALEGGR
jgi:hypothetical protein